MSSQHDAEQIRAEMARLRGGLHREVEDIVESARTMTDYRYYLKRYPWACVGAAVAVGYLVVPNKTQILSPDVETLKQLAKHNELLVKARPDLEKQPAGPLNALVRLAANALLRAGIAYAGQQMGKVFTESEAEPQPPSAAREEAAR